MLNIFHRLKTCISYRHSHGSTRAGIQFLPEDNYLFSLKLKEIVGIMYVHNLEIISYNG